MSHLSSISDFALSILRESCVEGSPVVCSPLSIGLSLSLLHAGAGGDTKAQIGQLLAKGASDEEVQEMFQTFAKSFATSSTAPPPQPNLATATSSTSTMMVVDDGSSSTPHEPPKVSVANRLYARADVFVDPTYLNLIKTSYDAVAENLNFSNVDAAIKTINDYVLAATDGKITNLVTPDKISGETAVVLVNALYFNAKWKNQFQVCSSGNDFFGAGGTTRKVDLMEEARTELYGETDEVQVLSLPYQDPAYTYDIFLPKTNVGLPAFLKDLTGKKLQDLLGSMGKSYVCMSIPKSKIETTLNLKETLVKLGIKDVFLKETADLSAISKEEKLFVSDVVHKALIEVDLEGTTAAAAAYTAMCLMAPADLKDFTANRPFLYTLSKNRAPIFIGVFQ